MSERIQSQPPVIPPDAARDLSRAARSGDEASAHDWFGESDTATHLPITLGPIAERFAATDIERLAERILGPIGA